MLITLELTTSQSVSRIKMLFIVLLIKGYFLNFAHGYTQTVSKIDAVLSRFSCYKFCLMNSFSLASVLDLSYH